MSTVVKCDGDCGKNVQYVSEYYEDNSPIRQVLPLKFEEEIVTVTEHMRKGKSYNKSHFSRQTYNFCSWACVQNFIERRLL